MNAPMLYIDGGTTNTRFTLMAGDQMLERSQRRVGAADYTGGPYNHALAAAVSAEVRRLETAHQLTIRRACASGMITSPGGLAEVPHISAPADVKALARAVRRVRAPELSPELEFALIPGVKSAGDLTSASDLMRGEETEIMGLLTEDCARKRMLVVHFGSHSKMIEVDRGRILRSVTTLSGELLQAVIENTVLKSSAGGLDGLVLDEAYVRSGYEASESAGISRALFMARFHQVLERAGPAQVSSFLLGCITQQDSQAFAHLLSASDCEIVLYGRDALSDAFLLCLKLRRKNAAIRKIPFAESQWLSLRGMRRILLESKVFGNASID